MEKPVYLLLENGDYFEGKSFGAPLREVTGEVEFTTGMTGYLETITDPSYFGQIVVQTFPLIGNYGVIPQDFENEEVYLSAYIVKEWCQEPSNFRCSGDLDTFFKERNIPGVYGIDTRKLAKTIRESGSMNGWLTEVKPPYDAKKLEEVKNFHITKAVETVTPKKCEIKPADEKEEFQIVLWDFGAKENIIRELTRRGCRVADLPAGTTAEEILAMNPDGIMLSNGPGNPEDNPEIIEEIRKITKSGKPMFGICLGMQMAVVEFARNVAGFPDANSSEFEPDGAHSVIHIMEDQKDIENMGGTMRLGLYPCKLTPGSLVQQIYGEELIYERHRHRFEFNNNFRKQLTEKGLQIAGLSPDERLVEIVSLPDHPWFIGVQFHPEFKSRPNKPQKLFASFIGASLKNRNKK